MEQKKEEVVEGILWKEILTPGTSRISQKPSEGSTCTLRVENVRCEDKLHEAETFDLRQVLRAQNTRILTGESEINWVIGEADCELDRRIERAIRLMKDEERSRLTIQLIDEEERSQGRKLLQERATGDKNCEISFEVVLEKHQKFKPIWEWTPEEKYEIAMKHKTAGVKLFNESEGGSLRYKDAFHRFSKACKILITLEPIADLELEAELLSNIKNLRIKLYNNMAVCQGKQQNYYQVIELCSKALSRDDQNVATLFRRGFAYGMLKDYERGAEDMKKLLSIEPDNREASSKLQQYQWNLRRANKNCNEMIKRMFARR